MRLINEQDVLIEMEALVKFCSDTNISDFAKRAAKSRLRKLSEIDKGNRHGDRTVRF